MVARHHGFADWAELERHLETINHYRRQPDEVDEVSDPADEFLAYACLRYGEEDSPLRWERAAQLLADHHEIRSNLMVAAACADYPAVALSLSLDSEAASRKGGPFGWEPLLYLAYARHDATIGEEATLATAQALLDHGADPNSGYLWHGLCPPFTALTGAFGSGEGDHPEHPHGFALARLLLDRGADPNDGQALYNRQFSADDRHLVLLLSYGLGRGDGGPWRTRLGQAQDSPAELISTQLWWAIVHDLRDRVRLLVENGADLQTPYSAPGGRPTWARTSHGRTPSEAAALAGSPEVRDYLVASGAPAPQLDGASGLIAAVLCGNRAGMERWKLHADEARTQRPGLIVWAASRRKLDAISTLVNLGFDVNAFGRSDIPMEQAWETALHHAAGQGDLELVALLLELGADPSLKDNRFDSTPLGWAHHFEQDAAARLLEGFGPRDE